MEWYALIIHGGPSHYISSEKLMTSGRENMVQWNGINYESCNIGDIKAIVECAVMNSLKSMFGKTEGGQPVS